MAEKGSGRMANVGDLVSQHSISKESTIRKQWERDYSDLLDHERAMMLRLKTISHEDPNPANLTDPPTTAELSKMNATKTSFASTATLGTGTVGRRPELSTTRQDLRFDDPKVPRHTATTMKQDFAYRPSLELFPSRQHNICSSHRQNNN